MLSVFLAITSSEIKVPSFILNMYYAQKAIPYTERA